MIYRPLLWFLTAYSASFLLSVYEGGRFFLAGTALILMVTVIRSRKHGNRQKGILCAVLFFWLFGLLRGRAAFYEQRNGPASPVPDCTVCGTVLSVEEKDTYTSLLVRPEGKPYRIEALLYERRAPSSGEIVSFTGRLDPLELPGNPGEWDMLMYDKTRGIEYRLQADSYTVLGRKRFFPARWRETILHTLRRRIEALLPEKEAGIASAMLLGERSGMDAELKTLFQDSGIAHILAISGLHLQILSAVMTALLSRILKKRRAAFWTTVWMWVFCFLTGAAVSTVRATVMITFANGALLLHRRPDTLSALAGAALVLLLYRPLYLFSAGFQLSFLACVGISYGRRLTDSLFFLPWRLRQGFCLSLSVSVTTAPVTLFHFHSLCPYAVLLNLLVVPLMSLLIPLLLLALLVSVLSMRLAAFLGGSVYYILRLYALLCRLVLALPFSRLTPGRPSVGMLLLFAGWFGLGLLYVERIPIKRGRLRPAIGLLTLLTVAMLIQSRTAVRLALLDTGQGDCAVLSAYGRTYILDAGPEYDRVLKPYLEYMGVRTVDGIFLSHMDSDHTEGALKLLQDPDFIVKNVYLPNHPAHRRAIEASEIRNPSYLERDDVLSVKDLTIRVLSPAPDAPFTDENAASMVLHISLKDVTILMTGDMDTTAETALLADDIGSDVLKVAHHGSKSASSVEFLEKVNPTTAYISCGENNSYGHPSPEVTERLEALRVNVCISYEDGALLIDGHSVTEYKEAYRNRWIN